MKQKFSELDVFIQLDNKFDDGACLVLYEGRDVSKMSINLCVEKIGSCLLKEFARVPKDTHIRIMVLTEESEVSYD